MINTHTIWFFFSQGGPFMWLILVFCGVPALAIFCYKWWQFRRFEMRKDEVENLGVAYRRFLSNRNKQDEVFRVCDDVNTPVARIIRDAISACPQANPSKKGVSTEDSIYAIRQSMEKQILNEVPLLEQFLSSLATIAYIAPLLGLAGTIWGLYDALLVESGRLVIDKLVSGIRTALLCTGTGLVVAIPCHVAYNYLLSRASHFCNEMEKAAAWILEQHLQPDAAASKKTPLDMDEKS